MNKYPIGVLDSGIGGLTVVKEIISELPNESIIYIGDSINSPYGRRTKEEIYQLTKRLLNFLIKKKVKLIVIACNTITVSSIKQLREDYPDFPIIGTVPVVKKAAAETMNKRIGILSTTRTANSKYQKELIKQFGDGCIVFNHGTDELVPLIEEGLTTEKRLKDVLSKTLSFFQPENIDTLALGCTHFPFLKKQIQGILGEEIQILDSGQAIARQVRGVLLKNEALANPKKPDHSFYLTKSPKKAVKIINNFFENKFPGKLEEIKLD